MIFSGPLQVGVPYNIQSPTNINLDDANSTLEISPVLLHLVHPFALQNLIAALKHIKRFYQYVKSTTASVEKSQIAKDLLLDLVDCSGLNLEGLETVLEASIQGINGLPREFLCH